MAIKLSPIPDSQLIEALGYDKRTSKLFVQFKAKEIKSRQRIEAPIYVYRNVPSDVAQSLLEAQSVGGYFIANVRNAYTCHRLTSTV